MGTPIQTETIIVASKDQVSSDLADEAAILNLRSGIYYGLDCVGARVWQLIQTPIAVAGIMAALLAEYDVDPVRCQEDLMNLIRKLKDAGLIEMRDETPA